MKEPDTFFVGVEKPLEVRLNILESSKQLIEILKYIERIHEIRAEKEKAILEMKTKIDELNKLTSKLSQTLPKTAIRQKVKAVKAKTAKKKRAEPKKKEIKKPAKLKPEPKKSKFDQELVDIERQLAKLKK